MAKVAFSKLKCKINDTEVAINFGEETIMVKQYLPIEEKLSLIAQIIQLAHDPEVNYANPLRQRIYTDLMIVFNYTNLSFTDKQKEDLAKLYDQIVSSGLYQLIVDAIPEDEYASILNGLFITSDAIYSYQHSVLGVLDTIKTDYSDTSYDLEKFKEAFQSSDVALLQDIVSKLG